MIHLKRAYDEHDSQDGVRLLVERLWPRGLSKEKAAIDLWLKDLAPSTELRKWYDHIPERWPEFQSRYWAELDQRGDLLKLLKHYTQNTTVTFIYAASDTDRNSAVALKEYLDQKVHE
ncbi:MAG: DUF488 family protein [Bacteroidales bacterium]|nr:DUF488 family protein [Bacteroidales bacterium]